MAQKYILNVKLCIILLLVFIIPMLVYSLNYYEINTNEVVISDTELLSDNKKPIKIAENVQHNCNVEMHWLKNFRQTYEYKLITDVKLTFGNNENNQDNIKLVIQGILNTRFLGTSIDLISDFKEENNLIFIAFQLSSTKVIFLENLDPDLEKLYNTMFIVAFTEDGKPVQFYFPEYLEEKDRISLSEIIYAVQIVIPMNKEKNQWATIESNSTGNFEVNYSIDNNCNVINKKIITCISLKGLDNNNENSIQLKGRVINSSFIANIDNDISWIKNFSGSETLEIKNKKNEVWSKSLMYVNLKYIDQFKPDPNLDIWKINKSLSDVLKSFLTTKTSYQQGYWSKKHLQSLKEQFQNTNLDQIIEEIEKAIDANEPQTRIVQLTHKLVDYLTVFPEQSDFLPDKIKDMEIKDLKAGNVILALELTGNIEAQEALINLIEDSNQKDDIRLKSIVAAGGIKLPDKTLIESLFKQNNIVREDNSEFNIERADTSILSLGILSDSLYKSGNKNESQSLIEKISEKLNNSEDIRERIACLKSLDNSENEKIKPIIEPFLQSDSTVEREAAASAFRHFNDEYSRNLLLNTYQNDASSNVKKAAIEALMYQGGDEVLKLVKTQLPVEKNEDIRRAMIIFLGNHKTPEVLSILQQQLNLETKKDIAEEIIRAIYYENYEK